MPKLTPQEYEAKREARFFRFLAAADKAASESKSAADTARSMADGIPLGQPILIGHYSEGRDRRYRAHIEAKFRKGYELSQKAEYYRERAESAQDNDAIYSDDPSAGEKLDDKIVKLETLQAEYKKVNAAYKKFLKDPASLDKSDLPESNKALIRNFKPDWHGDQPIPSYRLTNNNANIRRLKERSKIVEHKQALEDKTEVIDGIRIEYCPAENRIRIYFGKRVDLDTYKLLKQHGFRVLRSEGEGAFSGYYNNNCLWFIKTHIKNEKS